jgi:hypothetical protein
MAPPLRIRCRAALTVLPVGAAFGSVTAARLWGLPLPTRYRSDEPLHVVVFAPTRAPERPGVIGRQVADRAVTTVTAKGLPTVDLRSLFCHLGQVLSIPDLVAVGDALILDPAVPTRHRPYTISEALAERVRAYRWRGKGTALRALPHVRPGAESRPETLVRLALVDAGLPEPELGGCVYDTDGRFLALVDMVFHAYRVVVEYDGDHHRVDRYTFDRDLGRIDDLTAHGWRVVRIAGHGFFRDPTDAVRRIRRALLAGGWVP